VWKPNKFWFALIAGDQSIAYMYDAGYYLKVSGSSMEIRLYPLWLCMWYMEWNDLANLCMLYVYFSVQGVHIVSPRKERDKTDVRGEI
jgi:hypothetical protein